MEPRARRRAQNLGLVLGPLLALVVHALLPDTHRSVHGEMVGFPAAGRATAAVATWMAVWWLSEAIPVYATALVPLVLLPLLGATEMRAAAAPYAHELIFLFMGGFLIGLGMERWGLHRRIALGALLLVGERPGAVVAGFMLVSASLSMWVSNTATAIILLPVARSVIDLVARQLGSDASASPLRELSLCLLLGVAYAASIGGLATPIGTPPNLLLISWAENELGEEISFVRWMGMALPLVVVLLPVTWWLLTRVLYPIRLERIEGSSAVVRQRLRELGPMSAGERVVLGVFVAAAALWIARPLLTALEVAGTRPLAGLTDTGIAMLAALVLFVTPADRQLRRFVLDWDTALKLPWGILVLFGGGLSLAAAIRQNGVGELLGGQVASLAGIPPLLVVTAVVTLVVFLTELTSNTATTATLVPILGALAPGLGLPPLLLTVPAALSASCAFMLPVATPPNAVIFGSGLVQIGEMSRAGFWLNWIAVALVTTLTFAVVLPVLVSR